MKKLILFSMLFFPLVALSLEANAQARARDYGVSPGVMAPGNWNAITDVKGVMVGHISLVEGDNIRTGATAILPHGGNIFQQKVPGAVYIGNGFGKLAGSSQVQELGNIETPIVLTNTLNIAEGIIGSVEYTLSEPGNEQVKSVNALVGETNDGYLNDIRQRSLRPSHIRQAIVQAKSGPVEEGNIGAGTGTVCFGFKGGIGTASRVLPKQLGGYTVGALVQSNFGGVLQIDGRALGEELGQYAFHQQLESADGSCMIIIATDAPLGARNLERMAKRAMLGLAKTGGIASNGSGDYVIAFSTAESMRIPYSLSSDELLTQDQVANDHMSGLFMATIEATEEAIINSLFAAEDMTGFQGNKVRALPVETLYPKP
ncbi:D-aminopeptidase [Echinicola pacifica]|uniref:D-aminopeptidase n=1 Tax=Echinicola pacifica TaxID=346377 RepID=A0A918PPH8_9BACT|nr:P1 family peptidase [Echinicola pacifica]GGZ18326.1 D-aminopeptidase [Echinicola pacifica]